ncbi:MAG: hypothetical protein V2J65_22495 [Desulfobacteraceae bacterium]|jgi:hypothetical protein|nr:hypothetical protein [Desulfobacteraceae bacterium]
MPKITPPFFPIIYVRGYAMTKAEIEATVSTPYMGFNLGATKVRQDWKGQVIKHIFESPLVRLMKDYSYRDIYLDGKEITGAVSPRSIVIYRYYEQGDVDLGSGKVPSVTEAAEGLGELIVKLRGQVCGEDQKAAKAFRVYLVAHSMGGLVCRCFLQNPSVSSKKVKGLVDKVFTYATPHNGIEMAGMNVPELLNLWDMNNFNRDKMAGYLALPGKPERVDDLNGTFDPKRFFCLVGTNHKDYAVAAGLSRFMAGERSDGLVKIENATVRNAPRAFVYRSHSGAYGIVNSEEGYQNLIRFLFGNVQVNGMLEVEKLPLPPPVQKAYDDKKKVRGSYFFEATVSPRGSIDYKLTERLKETHSAVFRTFDEILRVGKADSLPAPRMPVLFSVFLDTNKITIGRTVVFGVDLRVSSTEFEIDGLLFFDRSIPGEYLFRNTIVIRATPDGDSWNVRYNLADDAWSDTRGRDAARDEEGYVIPLQSAKGFKGKLRLDARTWR